MDLKRKMTLAVLVFLTVLFSIAVYVPYEIYLTNSGEFVFSFQNYWWIVASFAGIAAVLLIVASLGQMQK